jgi:hypothetical protein
VLAAARSDSLRRGGFSDFQDAEPAPPSAVAGWR